MQQTDRPSLLLRTATLDGCRPPSVLQNLQKLIPRHTLTRHFWNRRAKREATLQMLILLSVTAACPARACREANRLEQRKSGLGSPIDMGRTSGEARTTGYHLEATAEHDESC